MIEITRKHFTDLDLMRLGESSKQIEQLIEVHPFSERIKFLLNNPEIAKRPVKDIYGDLSEPNCLGTSFFVAGVSKFDYPYHAYENELGQFMKQPIYDNIFPGVFNFSYYAEVDSWHSGIYLGEVDYGKIFFAQHGHARDFLIESLHNYSSPRYYIPETLATSLKLPKQKASGR